MKKTYVIVVTYNGMKWIRRCLDSLKKSLIPVHTLVIDNGSTDRTTDFIIENFPEVELHKMERNLGFGQANNFGMKLAISYGCDFIYLLNQDAYVYPDMFSKLLSEYDLCDKDKTAILSPLHLSRDEKHLDSHFKKYINLVSEDIAEDAMLGKIRNSYIVKGVPAAGWLLPRQTLERIGGFDPIFFHYGEDDHYIQRISYHGMYTVIVPNARMIHDRDGFGNVALANRDDLFRGIKTHYCLNPSFNNVDISKQLLHIWLSYCYESSRELFRGNMKRFYQYHSSFIRTLLNMRIYAKNRQANREIGPNWI